MKLRIPDQITVYAEPIAEAAAEGAVKLQKHALIGGAYGFDDVQVSFAETSRGLRVTLAADQTPVSWLRLRFSFEAGEKRTGVRILGDDFERAYGSLAWRGIEPRRIMPWYILVSDGSDSDPDATGRLTECFGVTVRPGAFVTWQYDTSGVTLWADVRNGGRGVLLGGRTLDVCEILFAEYRDTTAFAAGQSFCRLMCPDPLLPDHRVYGSNNWYYAYGNSSHAEIAADTAIVADQCRGLPNRPYMVIDDGWQINSTNAPWLPNAKFPDMAALADEISAQDVRPGIWVRYLGDERQALDCPADWRLSRDQRYLDPSNPAVLDYVRDVTKRLRGWGYELIKHDYSTFDIFGQWGAQMNGSVTANGWHFFDRTRTSAEIVVDLYRTILDAAGDGCVIIGCNTVSHLCAGLCQLNRTGDDTSGFSFEKTRHMGVNTLAFRMIQNGAFYMADADCVGITGAISWKQNRQWLKALAWSGSPLFVSCKPGVLNEAELAELRTAWAVNSVQDNVVRPLDWMEHQCPERWLVDGETVTFDWYGDTGAENFEP